ncbi:MAG: sugar-transfer associated ATP-grasp domain-containing protein, partial [Candidatus Moraniibacteriota bacterium]
AKRLADDKMACKRLLTKHELPVPALLARIKDAHELENFDWSSLPGSFALKPNHGFGGEGIIVVYGKKKDAEHTWIKADGSLATIEDLKTHIRNILDGSFSLANIPDSAFFEERLKLLKLFKPYTFKGVPDIRIIIYNKVPVMAMLRLPTKESGGRANLQQGAIGVGIDLASGTTTTAVWGKNRIIENIPGTRLVLSGIRIPYWKDILKMAIEAQQVSGLGFLGADVAIDRDRGPVFLELNARPGLSIQVANLDGLKGRLERVSGLTIKTIEKGLRMGMDLFGGEIEEELEEISGKKIIGTIEKVKLIGRNSTEIEVEAKIDTGADSTSIDTGLARELGFGETVDAFSQIDTSGYTLKPENENDIKQQFLNEYSGKIPNLENIAIVFSASGSSIRPVIKVTFIMEGIELISKVNITNRTNLTQQMIVGKKDLRKFLIQV